MTALLIRHADTAAIGRVLWGRKPGLSLSAAGAAQARRLATRLGRAPIDAIYASPRERAQETARPLALAHRLPVVTAAALDEVDFGDWSGREFRELDERADWRAFNGDRASAQAPNGERLVDVQHRIVAELTGLLSRHGGGTVAIVSHAEVIRCAVLHYLEMPLDAFTRIEIGPASITTITLADGTPTLLSINEPDRC